MARILLVEDDIDLAQRIVKWLTVEHSVEHISDGRDALEYLEDHSYDIIVLDWQLTEAQVVLKHYRAAGGSSPILILTGSADVTDNESGLDYLAKPFHPRELMARVRALSRK